MPAQQPPTASRGKPGSQSALRQRNSQLIVDTLARRGPTTQATLSRVTGLSTGTVSNLVKILERNDVVSSTPTIDSGRRALAIGLRAGGRLVAGIDIDRTELRVLISAMDQTIVAERTGDLLCGHRPEATLRRAASLLDDTLAVHGITPDRVTAAGISMATPLGLDSAPLSDDPLLPGWAGFPVATAASELLGRPCHVDNDSNLAALAQVTFGPFKDTPNLVFLKLAVGIGAGIIVNHALVRGTHGTAGEIGHALVDPRGRPCHCGNRGCLETVASTTAIGAAISKGHHGRVLNEDDIIGLARRRDTSTVRALEDAGYMVGAVLGSLANILNPSAIIIGGALTPIGAPLIDPIYRSFHRQALTALGPGTTLAANQLGARTEALGAAALAIARAEICLD